MIYESTLLGIKREYKYDTEVDPLRSLFEEYSTFSGAQKDMAWDAFWLRIRELSWPRRYVWAFCLDNDHHDYLEMIDDFAELHSNIVGECSCACLIKFVDDPDDIEDFCSYVRSYKWLYR